MLSSHSRRSSRTASPNAAEQQTLLKNSSQPSSANSSPTSPAQLILIHDPEDHPELELWQSDDEEGQQSGRHERDELDDSAILHLSRDSIENTVGALHILAFLLAPTLKLGATQLLNQTLNEEEGLPLSVLAAVVSLILFGLLSALSVQIYLMLGQYVRYWTIEGVVAEALLGVRGQRNRSRTSAWRTFVTRMTKGLMVTGASLLCASYLRESTDLLVPLVPKNSYVLERVGVAVGLGVLVTPLLANATLKSKRVVYSNLLAVLLYVVVGGVVIGHRYQAGSNGSSVEKPTSLVPRGPIKVHLTGGTWEWLNFALFALTNQFFVFPLFVPYAQAIASQKIRDHWQPAASPAAVDPSDPFNSRSNPKSANVKPTPPTANFFSLSILSLVLSIVFLALPFFVGPRQSQPPSVPPHALSVSSTIVERTYNALRVLQAIYLLLGIPPIWVTTVAHRLQPISESTSLPAWVRDIKWQYVLFTSLVALSAFAPPSLAHFISRTAGLLMIGFSFVVPAILHITLHSLRSPLAIVLTGLRENQGTMEEDLIRKKERAMQRQRWMKRAGWDLAVWLIMLPVGVVSMGWWVGRIFTAW